MGVNLEVPKTVWRRIADKLAQRSIASDVFVVWKYNVEFSLGKNPREQLRFVRSGSDSFHEFRGVETAGGHRFDVTWEIDWLKDSGRFILLDLHVVEIGPNLLMRPMPPLTSP